MAMPLEERIGVLPPDGTSRGKLHRPDGTALDVETTVGPLSWDGAPATQVTVRDVTAATDAEAATRRAAETLAEAEATLREAQQARQEAELSRQPAEDAPPETVEAASPGAPVEASAVDSPALAVAHAESVEPIYRTLLNTTHDGVAVVAHMRIVSCNPAFARMHGHATEQVAGLPLDVFVHPDDWPWLAGRIARWRAGEAAAPVHYRANRPDGRRRMVEIVAAPLSADVKSSALLVLTRDVTERIHMEQSLKEAEAA
ncbi:MAG: PAS domain S-box protein [SAR202 cluster bacterium]|nr:PAS domain S-box protein [SAR202 cluster bacterium]